MDLAKEIFESNPDCVKIIDLDGRLLSMNKNGCRIMEVDDFSKIENAIWKDFWPEQNRSLAENAFLSAKAGEVSSFEGACQTAKGNEKWWEVVVSPIRNKRGNILQILSISKDVTERKKMADQKAKLIHEIEIKNEELSYFAHTVAHDLRTPLATVTTAVEIFRTLYGQNLDDKADKMLGVISSSMESMRHLITGLLAYAEASKDDPIEPCDASSALQIALEHLQAQIAEKDAVITYDALPRMRVNALEMVQVLQNLIGNAIHYAHPQRAPHIHVSSAKNPEGLWELSVKDNGVGIAPHNLDKVFMPLIRIQETKAAGSGLGLAIVKRIVQRHEGQIWIESVHGQGATFLFTLPAA